MKTLRSDNRGEYTSKELLSQENGIRRQFTTPQQNGVSKRVNRSLMEKARCMREQAGLPMLFGGDAILFAAYLINRIPHSKLDGAIPLEVWMAPNCQPNIQTSGAGFHSKQRALCTVTN